MLHGIGVVKWLHQGCSNDLWRCNIFLIPCEECFKIFILALAPRSGFAAVISDAVARHMLIAFSDSRYISICIVMTDSRLLGATAACVMLLSFEAGHREPY